MMATSKPRVGIIGTGFGALVHLPAFQSEGWEVVALSGRSRDKARTTADAAGVEFAYADPLELIARDDLSAVAISTPPRTHHPLAIAALEAGKHVLCEKPFALDAREAAEMRDAAVRSKRTAMVAHEFRHAPQRTYVKKLLDDGYIGRFQLCTIELFLDRYVTAEPRSLTWMAYEAEGGGILGALGSHYIDGLRAWFGEVATVTGRLANLRPDVRDEASGKIVQAETDDTFSFTLEFVNGGVATMMASFATTPTRGTRIAVMGSEGTLLVEQAGPNPTDDGVVVASRNGAPLAPLATPKEFQLPSDPRDHRLMAFRMLVKEFGEAIAKGASPSPNFNDGWRCQQVLDAVRESSASGRRIDLA
jgi:predicted dehydrogenase